MSGRAIDICPECGGEGKDPSDWQWECPTCGGTGYAEVDEEEDDDA